MKKPLTNFLVRIQGVSNFVELKKTLVLLEKAAKEKDFKLCASLTKKLKPLRKLLSYSDILLILKHYMPDLFKRLELKGSPSDLGGKSEEEKLHCTE